MTTSSVYHPSLDEFRRSAERGNLIPVYREIMADGDTPVGAYAKLGRGEHSFLLESVVGGEKWAAYSFIGVRPRAVLRASGRQASVIWYDVDGDGSPRTATWSVTEPSAALLEVMSEWRPVAPSGLPRFWGGAVGWMAYDLVRGFENLPGHSPRGTQTGEDAQQAHLPDLYMVLTDTLVVFDNLRQTIKVVATPYVPRPERAEAAYAGALRRIDEVVERLRRSAPALAPLEPPPIGEDGSARLRWGGGETPSSGFDRASFTAAVERAKEYILAGDVFQVVLSQQFRVPRGGVDPFDVYRALRVVNPSPYMFHLEFPEARVTGASPETLVRMEGGRVEVRPIAGTRPRGASPEEDELLAAELKADAKECAEHLMLIDLGRNDVGRVSKVGTVIVSEQMVVERYSHVMHMVSHVHGDLDDGLTWHDVLRAAFPAGTLTGAPKIRAMEIIDELEPHRRGIYGGAVGYVSYSGNMDLAIAIRTLVTTGDSIHVQAGAGLVYDSVPDTEYEETLNKARAVLRAVALARRSGTP
ncbi:MAG TPA: anthranilate synthase component I [Kofleriaceae bacterium]|nr:anthranilate synthase component I [Kofleriaceae bacterium]